MTLTREQALANAAAVVADASRKMAQIGISDVDFVNLTLSHVAQNEGGRGGVYTWEVLDPEGVAWDYVQAPSVEEDN